MVLAVSVLATGCFRAPANTSRHSSLASATTEGGTSSCSGGSSTAATDAQAFCQELESVVCQLARACSIADTGCEAMVNRNLAGPSPVPPSCSAPDQVVDPSGSAACLAAAHTALGATDCHALEVSLATACAGALHGVVPEGAPCVRTSNCLPRGPGDWRRHGARNARYPSHAPRER